MCIHETNISVAKLCLSHDDSANRVVHVLGHLRTAGGNHQKGVAKLLRENGDVAAAAADRSACSAGKLRRRLTLSNCGGNFYRLIVGNHV